MTHEQLINKVNECIESDKPFIQKLINKAIASGCLDIDGAEDNFILPKNLLCAIYKEMANQYSPLADMKAQKKNIDNIYRNL